MPKQPEDSCNKSFEEDVLDKLFSQAWDQEGQGPRPYWEEVKRELQFLRKRIEALDKENQILRQALKIES